MASVPSKSCPSLTRRGSGHPPGARVMADAIALLFSYSEPAYAKKVPSFVCPGPEAFFAHVSRIECEIRTAAHGKRRHLRFSCPMPETSTEFLAFLHYLAPVPSNRISDAAEQALVIAERALAGYVFLMEKDDCEDWPSSHLVQPLGWFLKTLFPAAYKLNEKILHAEMKHVAAAISSIDATKRTPKKIFDAIEKVQKDQSFAEFQKHLAENL
jgi:hypothetical protein